MEITLNIFEFFIIVFFSAVIGAGVLAAVVNRVLGNTDYE